MAIKNKFCPRCMNIIRKNDTVCSECGMKVANINKQKEKKEKSIEDIETLTQNIEENNVDTSEIVVDAAKILDEENKQNKDADDKENIINDNEENLSEKIDKVIEENQGFISQDSVTDDLVEDGSINAQMVGKVYFNESEKENKPKRHKHKKKIKKSDLPEFTIDQDGSYNINTKDVTYLEDLEKPTPSIKKARGDMPKQEKLKWWEIYKWADRMLAKRKISKEVKKASRKIPTGISRGVMITLCLLFGWMGAHNFYAKNTKKGWFVLTSGAIVVLVISVPVLYEIMGIFVGGGLGFVVSAMWFLDIIGVITNRYKYRISKEEFISNLNVETRLKLGPKYVNLDKAAFKEKEKARLEKLNKKKNKKKNNIKG